MSLLCCSKDFENDLKLISGATEFPRYQVSPKPWLFKASRIFQGQLSFVSGTNISLYAFTPKEVSLRVIILVQILCYLFDWLFLS